MKKLRFLLSIAMFICICCNSNTNRKEHIDPILLKDLNKKYLNDIKFFGYKFVDHFPKKVTAETIAFTENLSPEMGNLELMMINRTDSNDLLKLATNLKNKSIATFNAYDSCLFIVNRFARIDNFYDLKITDYESKIINNTCYSRLSPIPNFWHNNYTTDSTQCKLPTDFKIYVLDAKSGKYFDDKYLTDGRFMPEIWKNGYSKGIALSEKRNVIIYWLLIW